MLEKSKLNLKKIWGKTLRKSGWNLGKILRNSGENPSNKTLKDLGRTLGKP
jgi:hypothetical protein